MTLALYLKCNFPSVMDTLNCVQNVKKKILDIDIYNSQHLAEFRMITQIYLIKLFAHIYIYLYIYIYIAIAGQTAKPNLLKLF